LRAAFKRGIISWGNLFELLQSGSAFLSGKIMTKIPCLRARISVGVIFASILMPCTRPAFAAGPSQAVTREALDQAIEHEKSRRDESIAGMVVGGIAIAGGSIYSTIAQAENHQDENEGHPGTHNVWVGYAVGLGAGLPIMGISSYVFSDSMHKLNLLRRQRLSVSYSPETHQPMLMLTMNY
jgi:hypothetical protein